MSLWGAVVPPEAAPLLCCDSLCFASRVFSLTWLWLAMWEGRHMLTTEHFRMRAASTAACSASRNSSLAMRHTLLPTTWHCASKVCRL